MLRFEPPQVFKTPEDVKNGAVYDESQILPLSKKLGIKTAEKFIKELREIRDDD